MVNSPEDLKKMSFNQLNMYAEQLRKQIISTVNVRGGHLASNLGCIELTIALHYVFNCPDDQILFDTGHQAYAHKIITGRAEQFENLRTDGGISGFERKTESVFDAYSGGHSGNSLSVALGILRARKRQNKGDKVIAVIGDGALTAGVSYEALNDIGAGGENLIIVLNDNKMSISRNVGAMSKYLAKMRMSSRYADFKEIIKKFCYAIPFVGDKLLSIADNTKDTIKGMLTGNSLFESIGIKYYGPFDGHNIKLLTQVFSAAKRQTRPVIIHVVTHKGRGCKYAEDNPQKFHGVSPVKKPKGVTFAAVFGEKLCQMAQENKNIAAITAAMTDGVGLGRFAELFPDRFFDAGIAEQHALDLAAGLAIGGMKPYFAVYSSFFQRAADQWLTDVCIDKLPVTLVIDHAGFVPGDGVTHQGIFDLSVLTAVPGAIICSPMDGEHLKNIMEYSLSVCGPIAIRFSKSFVKLPADTDRSVVPFKWNYIRKENNKTVIIIHDASLTELCLKTRGADIVFATFISPLDEEILSKNRYEKFIIAEDSMIKGGLGEKITVYFNNHTINKKTILVGYNSYLEYYSQDKCFSRFGLTTESLNNLISDVKTVE